MLSIRTIKTETELLSALKLAGHAFSTKCPLFLLEKISSTDFITYYFSINTLILQSKFSYAFYFSDEIKASFICLPASFSYNHSVPASMQYYDNFFSYHFDKNQKFINKDKCIYGLFLGSEYPGAGKLLYTRTFEDMRKEGIEELYWEMTNPINTNILCNLLKDHKDCQLIKFEEAFYKNKLKIDFFLTKFI